MLGFGPRIWNSVESCEHYYNMQEYQQLKLDLDTCSYI